jgi:hypothetical protein
MIKAYEHKVERDTPPLGLRRETAALAKDGARRRERVIGRGRGMSAMRLLGPLAREDAHSPDKAKIRLTITALTSRINSRVRVLRLRGKR